MSAPNAVTITPTIPVEYSPATNCAQPTLTLFPFGVDHITVNTTIRLGRVFVANYTTTILTRGVTSSCLPASYESLGQVVPPTSNGVHDGRALVTSIAQHFVADSCPPGYSAADGSRVTGAASLTTCCPS